MDKYLAIKEERDLDPSCYTFTGSLFIAIEACWNSLYIDDLDEHGGLIMLAPDGKYHFIYLYNQNAGTAIGPGLWTASQDEFAEKIIPLLRKGWKQHATFHTHPQFMANPSYIDLTELFRTTPVNYIYSPVEKVVRGFTWEANGKEISCTAEYSEKELFEE